MTGDACVTATAIFGEFWALALDTRCPCPGLCPCPRPGRCPGLLPVSVCVFVCVWSACAANSCRLEYCLTPPRTQANAGLRSYAADVQYAAKADPAYPSWQHGDATGGAGNLHTCIQYIHIRVCLHTDAYWFSFPTYDPHCLCADGLSLPSLPVPVRLPPIAEAMIWWYVPRGRRERQGGKLATLVLYLCTCVATDF